MTHYRLAAALALISACRSLPPLQLKSPSHRIYAQRLCDAEVLASDLAEYEPQVQALLGLDVAHQHVLVALPTYYTSSGSHGGTSDSGQMQIGMASILHPTESVVAHELVHAHFEMSGLPSLPSFLEEGIAYYVDDLIMERDPAAKIPTLRTDYRPIRAEHLGLSGQDFLALDRSLKSQAQALGYETVFRLGIREVIRLTREGVPPIELVELAGLGFGENSPPPRRQDEPAEFHFKFKVPPALSHP